MSGDYRWLYRSQDERMLAGVCGGIADYFKIDPTIVRLIFVALGFTSIGTWLLIYLVMAIIMPEEPGTRVDTVAIKTATTGTIKVEEA
jgi:phage shock protein C